MHDILGEHQFNKILLALVFAGSALFSVGCEVHAAADILQTPIGGEQLSEVTLNRSYERSHPLIEDKDNATVRLPESAPVPGNSEVPDRQFGFKDQGGESEVHSVQGGVVPSNGHIGSAGGFVDAFGRYAWTDPQFGLLVGQLPHTGYSQVPFDLPARVNNLGNGPMIKKLREAMNGLPITNSQFSILAAMGPQAAVDQALDPKGWKPAIKQLQQTQVAQGANQQALVAEQNGDTAFQVMREALINVANESSATPGAANARSKTPENVIWMVQQMYKHCYLPLALLFLLPGAVLTQAKGLVSFGILGAADEDTVNPFVGILRATIAIFLIPATQLIVSYAIDIGNSMTFAVKNHIDHRAITRWAHQQTFNTSPRQDEGFIRNAADVGVATPDRGKLAGASEDTTVFEHQSYTTSTLQNVFNTINSMISQGLAIMNGFQVVLICYLYLLGPLAAAFFAWPAWSVGNEKNIFKKTFSSWVDGVVILVMWKFWWCVVLLCMSVRIHSGNIDVTNQFEMFIYTAFMALLLFVPFQPFDFKPGAIVGQVLERAAGQAGGSGGGGTSGSGGASGGFGQSAAEGSSQTAGGAANNEDVTGDSAAGEVSGSSQAQSRSLTTVVNSAPIGSDGPKVSGPPASELAGRSDKTDLRVGLKDVQPPPLSAAEQPKDRPTN